MNPKIVDLPLVKYTVPNDTHHLFCSDCLNRYLTQKLPHNNIIVCLDEDSKKETLQFDGVSYQTKNMMHLLKAWAAFMDYFTGVKTTFTIAKTVPREPPYILDLIQKPTGLNLPHWSDIYRKVTPESVVFMRIVNEPVHYFGSANYANMQQKHLLTFKSGVFLSLPPEQAIVYMVHEFTAHRFFSEPFGVAPSNYDMDAPHDGHCATSPPGENKCLNGLITGSHFANFKNAETFFKNWYNIHKNDPITMFNAKKKKKPDKLPPKDTTLPAAYAAASPEIPEPADIDPVVEV